MPVSTNSFIFNENDRQLIALALKEDLGFPYRDITSECVFSGDHTDYELTIISKADSPIVLCGLVLIDALFAQLAQGGRWHSHFYDGNQVLPGQVVATLSAQAITLMMIERTLLNFLQRLSAIATLTERFVSQVLDTKLKILDTRKTAPGCRHLEKYAVFIGGGVNHRMGLYDAMMIKDNHIDLRGGLAATLAKLPENNPYPVIVEVRSVSELVDVLQHGRGKVKRVLLDNMTIAQLAECVQLNNGVFETEASGGITQANIRDIARTGVDYASIGALTHSAGVVDLSMRWALCQ